MSNDLKWLLSSDQQIPYHDPRALDLYFQVMKWMKPDVIDLLGDTSDQFCFSRFEKGSATEFKNTVPEGGNPLKLALEVEKDTKDFYKEVRDKSKRGAQKFVALGNHDIRYEPYFSMNYAEILEDMTPNSLWGLDDYGYDYIHYNDAPAHRFGNMYAHHGIFISKHSGESVRKDIDDLGVSLVRGHSHRIATIYKTFQLKNEVLEGHEIGHMCKVDSPAFRYAQIHNWQQGFAVGLIVNGTTPHIDTVRITSDYECVVWGKKFSA